MTPETPCARTIRQESVAENSLAVPTVRPIAESTVFVVDDEEPMRNALQRLFRAAGLAVEAHASAGEFLNVYKEDRPGCLLLDLMMPGMSGLELQTALAQRGFRIPIVFLTGSGQIASAVAAMKAGAMDFIEKPFDNEFLVERIRRALEHVAGKQFAHVGADEIRRRFAQLTPREREVMQHVVAGNTSKMTGRLLGASHRTIEIHRARIMEKMRADSLADLVRMTLDAAHFGA
jgi:FixJ family two-component response regulator